MRARGAVRPGRALPRGRGGDWRSCLRRSTAAILSTHASCETAGVQIHRLQLPDRSAAAAADHEGGARRRSGAGATLGHGAHASRSNGTRATARRHRRPAGRCGGSIRTRAGSGCSTAGRPSIALRASARRSHVFSVFVRAVPRLLGRFRGGRADRRALRPGRRACRASCGWR